MHYCYDYYRKRHSLLRLQFHHCRVFENNFVALLRRLREVPDIHLHSQWQGVLTMLIRYKNSSTVLQKSHLVMRYHVFNGAGNISVSPLSLLLDFSKALSSLQFNISHSSIIHCWNRILILYLNLYLVLGYLVFENLNHIQKVTLIPVFLPVLGIM